MNRPRIAVPHNVTEGRTNVADTDIPDHSAVAEPRSPGPAPRRGQLGQFAGGDHRGTGVANLLPKFRGDPIGVTDNARDRRNRRQADHSAFAVGAPWTTRYSAADLPSGWPASTPRKGLAGAGKHQRWTVPDIEYVLWAIVIGLLIPTRSACTLRDLPGRRRDVRVLAQVIVALETGSCSVTSASSAVRSLVQNSHRHDHRRSVNSLRRLSDCPAKLGSLLAIGTSSAGIGVVASKGAIRARNSDVSYAIISHSRSGRGGVVHAAAVGPRHRPDRPRVRPLGGTWRSTTPLRRRPPATCSPTNHGKIAVLVKSVRNALIGFVVLGFALYWASRGEADQVAPGVRARAAFIWAKFPKFVLQVPPRLGGGDPGLAEQGRLTSLATCRGGRSC